VGFHRSRSWPPAVETDRWREGVEPGSRPEIRSNSNSKGRYSAMLDDATTTVEPASPKQYPTTYASYTSTAVEAIRPLNSLTSAQEEAFKAYSCSTQIHSKLDDDAPRRS